jgi:hypothetical protein
MEGYYWPISAFHSYKDFGRYSMRYRQSNKIYSRLEMSQPRVPTCSYLVFSR